MWIANAAEVREGQDMLHTAGREPAVEKGNGAAAQAPEKAAEKGAVLEISEALKQMYQEQTENAEKSKEYIEDAAKIMEIARRIARGDHVPATDEKKLMEYNRELYQVAKQAAVLNANKKHKDYDSLFEDEDENAKRDMLRELKRENGEADIAAASPGTASAEPAQTAETLC